MKLTYRIAKFGKGTRVPVRDLSRLHARLVPMGTVALLGQQFMEKFNYRVLPREDLTFGAIAYVDDRPAGFIVATPKARDFTKIVVRRHWPQLLWVLIVSVGVNPSKWRDAYAAWRLLEKRPPLKIAEPVGEILTIGVLQEYRDSDFVRRHEIRIGADLLETVVKGFRSRGLRVYRVLVEVDNREVKLFYLARGWTVEQSVDGLRAIDDVELVFREDGASHLSEGIRAQ